MWIRFVLEQSALRIFLLFAKSNNGCFGGCSWLKEAFLGIGAVGDADGSGVLDGPVVRHLSVEEAKASAVTKVPMDENLPLGAKQRRHESPQRKRRRIHRSLIRWSRTEGGFEHWREKAVLGKGVEPLLLSEPDPKSGASANSATRA